MRLKVFVLLVGSLLFALPVCAQQESASDSAIVDNSKEQYNFKWKQTILPASLIGAGAIALAPTFIRDGSHSLTNSVIDLRGDKRRLSFDSYIEFVPLAGALALDFIPGVEAKHSFVERTLIAATSYAALGVMVKGTKLCVSEKRPEFDEDDSFPSGHTATAFMGAELVRIEYGGWYGVGAYAVATTVGFMRMYNGKHYFHDVVAGAGVGILSARIGEWSGQLWHKLLSKRKKKTAAAFVLTPIASPFEGGYYGVSMACVF